MESDVSLGSSVTPDQRYGFGVVELTDLEDRHDTCVSARNPPSHSARQPFRLILPEAIAIGVRFSHASRTGLDPWQIAQ